LVELTLPDLWRALENGDIVDAKTLVAAQWLQLHSPEAPPPSIS